MYVYRTHGWVGIIWSATVAGRQLVMVIEVEIRYGWMTSTEDRLFPMSRSCDCVWTTRRSQNASGKPRDAKVAVLK